VIAAAGNKMEIWDSNKYKKFFDSFSSDAFSDLGRDVMGGGNLN
jgi:MraZ protein